MNTEEIKNIECFCVHFLEVNGKGFEVYALFGDDMILETSTNKQKLIGLMKKYKSIKKELGDNHGS